MNIRKGFCGSAAFFSALAYLTFLAGGIAASAHADEAPAERGVVIAALTDGGPARN